MNFNDNFASCLCPLPPDVATWCAHNNACFPPLEAFDASHTEHPMLSFLVYDKILQNTWSGEPSWLELVEKEEKKLASAMFEAYI